MPHGLKWRVEGTFWNHGMHIDSVGDLITIGILDANHSRESEKKELQNLNERLANYIERVHFYKTENGALAQELKMLKNQVREPSQIKDKYDVELEQVRRLLTDANKEKAHLTVDVEELRVKTDDLRKKLDAALKDAADAKGKFERQNCQLSDLEGEVGLLKRRLTTLETERDKEKERNTILEDDLDVARKDLNTETLLHIDAENNRQSLEDELLFIKSRHEQELKEARAMNCWDSTTENREYWDTRMGLALRDIQETYNRNVQQVKSELERHYSTKLQMINAGALKNHMQWAHFKEENVRLRGKLQTMGDKPTDAEYKYARLKDQFALMKREKEDHDRELEMENSDMKMKVVSLQATIDAMIKEIKIILDSRHGLELEIITYRRLLETEENLAGFHQTVNAIEFPDPDNRPEEKDVRRETGTLTFVNRHQEQRTTKESGTLTFDHVIGKKIVEHLMSLTDLRDQSVRERGEMNVKVTFEKVYKSSIAITECSIDGKNVVLVNTLEEEESLRRWSLTRSIDGKNSFPIYKFDDSTFLRPGQTLKVWAKGAKPYYREAAGDLESDQDWLGDGVKVVTYLVNPAGEERATYTLEFGWRR